MKIISEQQFHPYRIIVIINILVRYKNKMKVILGMYIRYKNKMKVILGMYIRYKNKMKVILGMYIRVAANSPQPAAAGLNQ